MCSSTRGPANAPSLVTWPTSTRAKLPALASRINSNEQARTCATVPGALSIASSHIVWIESMTTSVVSFACSKLATMSRTLIAVASSIDESATANRRARSRIWSMDSSPETYSTRRPDRARRAAACSSSVDLPMPGSPPTRTAEDGTKPPPSTRSSSSMPIAARGGGSALPARPTNVTLRLAVLAAGPGRATTASSSIVFHSPQVSQRPAHFKVTAPQD